MKVMRTVAIFIIIGSLAIIAGCRSGSARREVLYVPTERVEIEVTHKGDIWDQIAEQQWYNQMRSDRRHKESLEFWDNYGKNRNKTMSKFGRNLNEIDKMRKKQRNSPFSGKSRFGF